MVVILTTIRYPTSKAQEVFSVVTNEAWGKLTDPEESNLGLWTAYTSDMKGMKWVWMKKISRESFFVNYTGTARRAMYLSNEVDSGRYKIEILSEDPEMAEEIEKWTKIIGQ
jgi:hypothetical protein